MTCGIYEFKIGPHSYIGSSKNCEYRLKRHESRLRNKIHGNDFAQNAYNKYGEFEYQVIFVCEENELRKKEGMLQRFFKPDLCHRIEDENGISHSHDEKTRAKISAITTVALSNPDVRAKMSNSHKGKGHPRSDVTRAKISESHKGMRASDVTRAKMSESAKNRRKKYE